MMDKTYIETVRLLLESAPAVFATPHFAMKGGTAINLFIQNMPRLSVDIDAVYADHSVSRPTALKAISRGLEAARKHLAKAGIKAEIRGLQEGEEIKLFVHRGSIQMKVEVNHVFRGTILPTEIRQLNSEARELFTTDLSLPVLAAPELYGSKLVAAMDRQHPRDLFDIDRLFALGGLTPQIVECFVCYLAGHNRPVHEVLFSRDQDMTTAFENEFQGMTRNPTTLAELEEARTKLRLELLSKITANQKQFLIGLVSGEPDWQLIKCPHLSQLPAIQWKLKNLARLRTSNPRKFAQQADELRARFAAKTKP
jgi:hypothetical protein